MLMSDVKNLSTAVGSLTEEVQGLRDDLNQRKGAKRAFIALSACIGGASGALGAWIKAFFISGAAN
jgi:hypothetical protein